jgi:DNA-binding response OmpR family regulator
MLIDYKLPGMNGLDLAQAVRQIAPQTQIVMMSASKPADLEDRVASLQLAGYVDKPFRVSEIRRFVTHC